MEIKYDMTWYCYIQLHGKIHTIAWKNLEEKNITEHNMNYQNLYNKKKKYRCKYFESKGRTKTFNIQVKTLLEINIIKTKVGKRKE